MPAALLALLSHPSPSRPRLSLSRLVLLLVLAVLAVPASAAVSLNTEEQKLAQLLTGSSDQRRDRSKMVVDARLCQVARSRAMDMAKRRYFSHTNPDGEGPNYLVRKAGYPLPSHYSTSKSANNVESIGSGYTSASACWSAWMGSSGHKTHLLATESFYRDQTTFGVGYYYDPGSPYGRYYVVITAPPAGDTLTITSPTSGARVVSNQVTVNGKVSGSPTVSQLVYRLETPSGAGTWRNAPVPSGAVGDWSAQISGLALGNNTIRVRALDGSGAVMKEATRSVRLVVLRPLVVEVVGNGMVTAGFLGTTQREVGATYSIAGTAKTGAIFSHWEGFPDSATRNVRNRGQSFQMAEGLALRAHFIPNPFLGREGRYEGLLTSPSPAHASSGVLRLNLTANGGFSGQLILGPSRLAVRGTLNSAGSATVIVTRPGLSPLTLTVNVDLVNQTRRLTATLTDGSAAQWQVQADQKAALEPGTVVPAQRYTFRIHPDANVPASPQAFGFGAATVTNGNSVVVSGTLPDGRAFSSASTLAANGNIALYAPVFGTAGAFTGSLQIADGTLNGTAHWFRPARPLDARYKEAFTSANVLAGAAYTRPAVGALALPWQNGTLALTGGNLTANLSQDVTLGTNHRLTWAAAQVTGLKISLNVVNGTFTGSFLHPETGTTRGFRGVIIPAAGGAWGNFIGSAHLGSVLLNAAGH